jgi:hypothetical protein
MVGSFFSFVHSPRLPVSRAVQVSCFGLFALGAFAAPSLTPKSKPVKKTIEYNRDVRPIITKCFTCHGHDAKEVKADLRLDERADAIKDLGGGVHAIVPYHPEKSELITRIYSHGDDLMPPASSNKVLTSDEKQVMKQWILEGAEYKPHWAFVVPIRPPLPAVKLKTWPKSPIDYFILDKLEEKGLKPSPEADKRTLIRRVSLDLDGLPPTQGEVQKFVNDHSPNAYEKVVDRLLASPRYGERMAMDWMDYSRFADSNGYQGDWQRFQWRWRDWILDAFNSDMPYDRFTIEQLAGDLLPHATTNDIVATGFNRNHRINTEGGVIPEEWRVETVIDRVETTSEVWLGLTAGCARCHDHKYDPIKQADFYSLYSYFNNVPETGSGNEAPVNIPPVIADPTPEQTAQIAKLKSELVALEASEQAEEKANEIASASWQPTLKVPTTLSDGIVARYRLANPPTVVAGKGPAPTVTGNVKFDVGRDSGSISTNDKAFVDLGDVASFDTKDQFSYGAWVNPAMTGGSVMSRMDVGHMYRGWDLFLEDGRPAAHIISDWPSNALKVVSKIQIPSGKWSHVFVTYDGSAKPSGVHIYVDGKATETTVEASTLTGSIKNDVHARLGRRVDADIYTGQIDDPAIYSRTLTADEVAGLAQSNLAAPILAIAPEKRTPAQVTELARLYLLDRDESFRKIDTDRQKTEQAENDVEAQVSTVLVMQEMPQPRQAHILLRGQYDHPGAPVSARLPLFLQIKGETFPPNRLGLAEWIMDPKNPLTARVTVNRLWERLFGTGIVATSDDFGTRAEYPSHPELLDWMATELVRLKWHLKPMLKEMVMSATYRQSSNVSPALEKLDSANRLLARGPRFRLPAEVIRDQAMYVGGLLTEKVGGPSVRPYQPLGIWDETSVYGNLHNYKHDMGADLHRRSLYTIWKRTAAPPNMTLFDVPSREICTVDRARTDTPLQALDLMNDVTYLEASRALAQRMLKDGGSSDRERLAYGFRSVLGRNPNSQEMDILNGGLDRMLARYKSNAKAATELISIGDLKNDPSLDKGQLAAYTLMASTVLNLDETITKE